MSDLLIQVNAMFLCLQQSDETVEAYLASNQSTNTGITMPGKSLAVAIFILLIGTCASWAETEVTSPELQRTIMRDLSQSLRSLVEISIGSGTDERDEHHEAALQEADKLVAASGLVEDHVGSDSVYNRKLGISLTEQLSLMREAIELGEYYGLDYHLISVVDNCVGCHSRLPREQSATANDTMFDVPRDLRVNQSFLGKFYVATRQFQQAMETIEEDIRSYDGDLLEADLAGEIDDYLWITVRSAGEVDRARSFLAETRKILKRPRYLRRLIRGWESDLEETESLVASTSEDTEKRVQLALTLIDRSRGAVQVPFGREGLVTDLVAARILETILSESSPPTGGDLAEVYYQLGLIEARMVGLSYASPYMEYLFEAAIRADPRGARAKSALRLLEEFGVYTVQSKESTVEYYERSVVRLDALRQLMGVNSEDAQ